MPPHARVRLLFSFEGSIQLYVCNNMHNDFLDSLDLIFGPEASINFFFSGFLFTLHCINYLPRVNFVGRLHLPLCFPIYIYHSFYWIAILVFISCSFLLGV
jgi:hypothetical protein